MRKLIALVLLLAGCGSSTLSPGPRTYTYCTRSEIRSEVVYWPSSGGGIGITPYGVGIHVGGGLHVVQRSVCVAHASYTVVEGWQ